MSQMELEIVHASPHLKGQYYVFPRHISILYQNQVTTSKGVILGKLKSPWHPEIHFLKGIFNLQRTGLRSSIIML